MEIGDKVMTEGQNICIKDAVLDSGLVVIRKKASELWEAPLIRHYTKHGIEHSEKIIKIMNKLVGTSLKLNDDEAFVLLAATYLHDIGMQQSNTKGLTGGKVLRDLDEMDYIRENHNDISYAMVINSIKHKSICPSLGLENFRDYVENIACLVKYHRKHELDDLQVDFYKGNQIRIPLLAALLRLGDELHADCDRVNVERLKFDNIPKESKIHWWCCLYVKSIDINEGKIKVIFRFPQKYEGNSILEVIKNRVLNSIKEQLDQVYELLDSYGLRLYKDVLCDVQYSQILDPIPIELWSDLKKKIIT